MAVSIAAPMNSLCKVRPVPFELSHPEFGLRYGSNWSRKLTFVEGLKGTIQVAWHRA
jgi:hypothetical protein